MKHPKEGLIELGVITGPHGIKGEVLIKPFGQTPLEDFDQLTDETGAQTFKVTRAKLKNKGRLVANLAGITNRNQAEALKGTLLCIERSALPPLEDDDEFYYQDLIGLEARLENGDPFGKVIDVANHGASDILEILPQNSQTSMYLVFTKETVPEIKIEQGHLTIKIPDEIELDEKP